MFEASDRPARIESAVGGARPSAGAAGAHASPSHGPRISSQQLLGAARDLIIEHAGQEYCLHLTRNDKLILTK